MYVKSSVRSFLSSPLSLSRIALLTCSSAWITPWTVFSSENVPAGTTERRQATTVHINNPDKTNCLMVRILTFVACSRGELCSYSDSTNKSNVVAQVLYLKN